MRPPELETKLETGAFGPDVLYTRYGDSPANAVCIAPRTMPTAPGDALKIVRRLDTWPELVEACEDVAQLDALVVSYRMALPSGFLAAIMLPVRRARTLLARCKECPMPEVGEVSLSFGDNERAKR